MKISNHKAEKMFKLGYELAFESKKRKKDWTDIFNLWSCAANVGHKRAQFYLATCYDNALGTQKDLELAFYWYLKAAKQGHRESQYNIGFFYKKGEFVKCDYKKSVRPGCSMAETLGVVFNYTFLYSHFNQFSGRAYL